MLVEGEINYTATHQLSVDCEWLVCTVRKRDEITSKCGYSSLYTYCRMSAWFNHAHKKYEQ